MNSNDIDKIEEEVLNYIAKMKYGESSKTAIILHELGYDNIDFETQIQIDIELYRKAKERGFYLDKSHYKDRVVGLPQNLSFYKRKLSDITTLYMVMKDDDMEYKAVAIFAKLEDAEAFVDSICEDNFYVDEKDVFGDFWSMCY